jgi:phosphopantothenoylcysteine synthetase/decarboxylase
MSSEKGTAMPRKARPVLYIVACGGRPAGQLSPFIPRLQARGWEVCVIATPSALKFMDTPALEQLTGHVVRYDYKQPDEPDILPLAAAMALVPATFNTINKWASGISDTLALGLLNEAIGLHLPVVAVPTPNVALAKHPAFIASVKTLRSWGVRILLDPDTYPLPTPNMGPAAAELFPWEALEGVIEEVRVRVEEG